MQRGAWALGEELSLCGRSGRAFAISGAAVALSSAMFARAHAQTHSVGMVRLGLGFVAHWFAVGARAEIRAQHRRRRETRNSNPTCLSPKREQRSKHIASDSFSVLEVLGTLVWIFDGVVFLLGPHSPSQGMQRPQQAALQYFVWVCFGSSEGPIL